MGRKPSYTREQLTMVQSMLGASTGISAIAKATGLTRQTIYRIKDDPAAAEASLTAWSDRRFDVAA
jgi:putative DNA-invertase from lambdoid prophage Rac